MFKHLCGARSRGAILSGVFALTVTTSVFAVDVIDDPVQIDERAADLAQTSNSLCWEMHRFHQQEPEFRQTYRNAKEIWTRAGQLREALRAGPVETDVLQRQVTEINEIYKDLEQALTRWSDGDRTFVSQKSDPARVVEVPAVAVDIPFVGVRVGGRRQYVVTGDGPAQLERRRLHPNSRGSKRSLERELDAVKIAVSYLLEDSGVPFVTNELTPDAPTAIGPSLSGKD